MSASRIDDVDVGVDVGVDVRKDAPVIKYLSGDRPSLALSPD